MQENFSERYIKKTAKEESVFVPDQTTEKGFLGKGASGGIVKEIEIKKGSHIKNFAVKDFSHLKTNYSTPIRIVKREYDSYLVSKEAGLKVFPTFRISEDNLKLLMTLGNTKDFLLIGKDSDIEFNKVEEISNLKEVISSIKENIQKAVKAFIELSWDSYFFIINKNNPTQVDFITGDFGGIDKDEKVPSETLLELNMVQAQVALDQFIMLYVNQEKREFYYKITEQEFSFIKQ
jgi:hypothetical protein